MFRDAHLHLDRFSWPLEGEKWAFEPLEFFCCCSACGRELTRKQAHFNAENSEWFCDECMEDE